MKIRLSIGMQLLLLAFVLPLKASLIVYDGFNYTSGQAVEGQLGGTGWNGSSWYDNSGNGINNNVSTPGLTYSTLQTVGNKVTTAGSDNGSFRYLGSQGGSGSIYVSFVVQRVSGSSSGYGGISLYSGNSTEQFFIGQRFNQDNFGLERHNGAGDNSSTAASSLSFLVLRIDFNGSSSSANLYVNPSLGAEPGSASASISGFSSFNFDTVRIQSGGGPTFDFDELRIGSTYGDVTPVPEPVNVSLAIFATGILILAGIRRCKSRASSAVHTELA